MNRGRNKRQLYKSFFLLAPALWELLPIVLRATLARAKSNENYPTLPLPCLFGFFTIGMLSDQALFARFVLSLWQHLPIWWTCQNGHLIRNTGAFAYGLALSLAVSTSEIDCSLAETCISQKQSFSTEIQNSTKTCSIYTVWMSTRFSRSTEDCQQLRWYSPIPPYRL